MTNENTQTNIAIYIDLENLKINRNDKTLNVNKLMNKIKENASKNTKFIIKYACGNLASIENFESELKNWHFELVDIPPLVLETKENKTVAKNRADIAISIKALKDYYTHKDEIDLFIFITSDSDFTLIMDELFKLGKRVWLVCEKSKNEKDYFKSCTDKILSIEDFIDNQIAGENEIQQKSKDDNSPDKIINEIKEKLKNLKFNESEIKIIVKALIKNKNTSIEKKKLQKKLGRKAKIYYSGKSVQNQHDLLKELEKLEILKIKKSQVTISNF